jgi:hypothetical protein
MMPVALLAQAPARDCPSQSEVCNDEANRVIKLDLKGTRGPVCFRHKTHEAYTHPSSDFPHKAEKGSECAICHHKRSEATGAPILVKCSVCHRNQGDPGNPRNRDMDEMHMERAFHELCIGCHRSSNEKAVARCKAPVACGECHATKTDASAGAANRLLLWKR